MLENWANEIALIGQQTQQNLPLLLKGLGVLFGCYVLNVLLGNRLLLLGIRPRHLFGLPGIVCAPFLHAHFNHLFFNAIPLVVLSDLLLLYGVDFFIKVTIFITLGSGLLTWCFGRPAIHVGASGLITGYWGFLIITLFSQGSMVGFVLGLLTVYYFFGIFLGIFPSDRGVSFEGHLFGLITGLVLGYFPELLNFVSF